MDIFTQFKCPVCEEIPEGKIFQCVNKHVICLSCLSINKSCPSCGVSLITDENRTRFTSLEAVLDDLDLPCRNKSLGCTQVLKRGQVKAHVQNECKFGIGVKTLLCQQIGFHSCRFECDSADIPSIVDHFKSCHTATIVQSSTARIRYSNFGKMLHSLKSERYIGGPVIIQRVGQEITTSFLVLPICSKASKSLTTCSWLCIFLGSLSQDGKRFSMEVTIRSKALNTAELKWTTAASCLENFGPFVRNPPYLIPWSLLKENYCESTNLLLDIKIQQEAAGPIKAKASKLVTGEVFVDVEMPADVTHDGDSSSDDNLDSDSDSDQVPPQTPLESGPVSVITSPSELHALGTFEPMAETESMFYLITQYIKTSSGLPDSHVNVKIHGISKIRKGLLQSVVSKANYFSGNKTLLWFKTTQGSVNRLAQGENVCIGFYDRIARAFPVRPENLKKSMRQTILLCAVYLGNVYQSEEGYNYWSKQVLPEGFNAVKGMGRFVPVSTENLTENYVVVPCGQTRDEKMSKTNLEYNEFMVYEAWRVRVKYAVDIEIFPS